MTTVGRGWRAAAAICAAAIFVSGLLPTQTTVTAVSGGHEDATTTAAHFVSYIILGFLLPVAIGGWRISRRTVLVALVFAAMLGGVIELVQGPLPYRDAQLSDFIVDVAGAALGILVFSGATLAKRSPSHPG